MKPRRQLPLKPVHLRVGLFPFGGKQNPYTTLIGQCLDRAGIRYVSIQDTKYFPIRRAVAQDVHVLQMYWPGNFYHSSTRLGTWLKRVMFADGMRCLRRVAFVYSVENLHPHDSRDESLDKSYVQRLVNEVDGLIVMADTSRRIFAETYRIPDRVVWGHVPHCNYIDCYPNTVSRAGARAQLGLRDDQRVLLSLGRIAGYKGLSQLTEAFMAADVPDSVLLVAGRPQSPDALREVEAAIAERAAGKRSVIKLVPKFIPDEELQVFFNAADATALSYSDIPMNPGSVVLAMSFGRCVWAPRKGATPELVGQRAYFGYEEGDMADAVASLRAMLSRSDLPDRGADAYQRAVSNHGPDVVAGRFANFYLELARRLNHTKS